MTGQERQGDHKGRPYEKRFPVGAGLVPALARNTNGLETIYKLEELS